MQKEGLTPDQKLRTNLYACLEPRKKNPKQINIIGNDFPTKDSCELFTLLEQGGYDVKDISTCRDFEEYLSMSESILNLSYYPPAKVGAELLSKRLGMKHLYLPACFDYEEIAKHLKRLADTLEITPLDTKPLRKKCDLALKRAYEVIGETPVALDATAFPRVLGLAKLLLSYGFHVFRIYTDSFSLEEQEEYLWLKEHAPSLTVCPTMQAGMRVFPRGQKEKVLAIGQKAAYFHQTEHFVNIVEGGGLYGYDGICVLAQKMIEAFREKKDTKDLIVRKGLGCESCI